MTVRAEVCWGSHTCRRGMRTLAFNLMLSKLTTPLDSEVGQESSVPLCNKMVLTVSSLFQSWASPFKVDIFRSHRSPTFPPPQELPLLATSSNTKSVADGPKKTTKSVPSRATTSCKHQPSTPAPSQTHRAHGAALQQRSARHPTCTCAATSLCNFEIMGSNWDIPRGWCYWNFFETYWGSSWMNGGPSTVMFTLPYFFPFPNVAVIGAIARAEAYLTRSFGSFGHLSCRVGCQNQAFVTSTQHVTDNQFKYVVLSISCCN